VAEVMTDDIDRNEANLVCLMAGRHARLVTFRPETDGRRRPYARRCLSKIARSSIPPSWPGDHLSLRYSLQHLLRAGKLRQHSRPLNNWG
jgi:hypothetical protein